MTLRRKDDTPSEMEPFCKKKKVVSGDVALCEIYGTTTTYRERNHALAIAQPALPLLLFNRDAADADDLGGGERVGVRQHDFDGLGLLVDDVRDVDFLAAHADFDGPLFVLRVFFDALLVPLGHALQAAGDDDGRDVLGRPGLDGQRGLARADVEVVGLY